MSLATELPRGTDDGHALRAESDPGRPIEVVTDRSKSRKMGFLAYQPTDDSFFERFARLPEERLIP